MGALVQGLRVITYRDSARARAGMQPDHRQGCSMELLPTSHDPTIVGRNCARVMRCARMLRAYTFLHIL